MVYDPDDMSQADQALQRALRDVRDALHHISEVVVDEAEGSAGRDHHALLDCMKDLLVVRDKLVRISE